VGDRARGDEAAGRRHPLHPLLGSADLRDRVDRGEVRHAVVRAADTPEVRRLPGDYTRIAVGGGRRVQWRRWSTGAGESGAAVGGWLAYERAYDAAPDFVPDGPPDRVNR